MASALSEEIDALTAERERTERENPGYFWGDGDLTVSPAEAEVFGIRYNDATMSFRACSRFGTPHMGKIRSSGSC